MLNHHRLSIVIFIVCTTNNIAQHTSSVSSLHVFYIYFVGVVPRRLPIVRQPSSPGDKDILFVTAPEKKNIKAHKDKDAPSSKPKPAEPSQPAPSQPAPSQPAPFQPVAPPNAPSASAAVAIPEKYSPLHKDVVTRSPFPPIPNPNIEAPETMKPLGSTFTKSEYVCVIPDELYRDQRIKNAIEYLYMYIIDNKIPIKFKEGHADRIGAESDKVIMLPCIVTTSPVNAVRDMVKKVKLPSKNILLTFYYSNKAIDFHNHTNFKHKLLFYQHLSNSNYFKDYIQSENKGKKCKYYYGTCALF